MKISKTTFNFAEARGMFLSANNGNSKGFNEVFIWIDSESGEPDCTYIQNDDGTLTFGCNFNLKMDVLEEIPALIRTEVEFRKVLDFMVNA